jgi:hypothetical protein
MAEADNLVKILFELQVRPLLGDVPDYVRRARRNWGSSDHPSDPAN